ncbi:DNA-3-methyladenine glycosylase I [Oceanotoga teriensis]|jgi:DNA-3-methyladenine glycosylase I|uniref:DNA-3-methyladenine glycosylase I n=1 Tax=Oceanotoga teriensis TaxID=515440 RepID=UPI0027126A81|nr:DNA-3-methyladenine glycosylase I [Oceanotoga teriensis]MDO7977461.1 DNA-3-methyladenine glycosylase I [Oceanotoga teriensis]
MNRCDWVTNDEIYIKYHDEEWGIPVHDDRKLFEMLILEGAQAGLSWITVLKKRENYRKAFDNFDYNKIANYDDKKIDKLLKNSGIIRNKRKINSAINNSKIFIKIVNEFDSFDKYLWSFVNFKPIKNNFNTIEDVPSKTELSDKISKDLKKRGMSFVGSTIIYSYLQAVGVVDDHIKSCFKNKRS